MATGEPPANADNLEAASTRTIGSAESNAGALIGRYHLLQKIGEGGMGEVWLAEQKEPVRRRVAIKLIKAGMDTREVVARFESERQALALMDHPAIAKVFDAGSTPQGAPYFVMEYVAGVPITSYCDNHRLSTRERLELFTRVCEGVQHAHQKAIIHRDLKPSNILVTEVNGHPAPKIIDFGVAKALTQKLTADTMFTRVGTLIGTPEYMSPEQALSSGEDIDTRTDVYSLGIIFYELLAGAPPIELHKIAFDEFLRRLREDDPPRPSTKFRTQDATTSTELARKRHTEPPALVRQMRGDLDSIALKALEKDRSRRYTTPSELAADIESYLRNDPVMARPASAAYLARKYIRRHRFGVAVAIAAAFLLISFSVVQAFQLQRTTRERDRATRERNRADRITEFMTTMFNVSDPSAARGNSITAREILDRASKEIDPGLSKDPELQAQMMHIMGDVYLNLGLYYQAQSLLTRAVDIRRRVLGRENPETLASMSLLASILNTRGNYAAAEQMFRETLDIRRRVLGPHHRDTLGSMMSLANGLDQYEGRYAEAETLARQVLEDQRRSLGPGNPEEVRSIRVLDHILGHEGRYAEAEKLCREALDIERRVAGPENQYTLESVTELALILVDEGRYAEAEKFQRQALNTERRIFGLEHESTLYSMAALANILYQESHYSEAEKAYLELAATDRRVHGEGHPETAIATYNLACIAALTGKHGKALALLREAIDHGLPPRIGLVVEKDADFKSLHGDPKFDQLIAHAKQRAAAQSQEARP
jgi:eukaryotic-like serine/threonine-protein kinase